MERDKLGRFIKGYKHTEKWKKERSREMKSEKGSAWKGKDASYYAFHIWLYNTYGKPKQCEDCKILPEDYRTNKGLKLKSYPIQYALIKGKEHDHNRKNYICLCLRCHRSYDGMSKKQIEALNKGRLKNIGIKRSDESKRKIGEKNKINMLKKWQDPAYRKARCKSAIKISS